ncbi:triphosphoribosyl-dephospho-CoA synthase [Methylotenera sp.]|uniref:triphosphoribosyl-dephospho-CoA synthase n=1 Tax=Methylotenera sp. TaxID=2051956 RepID=UPI0027332748|nr:triphosphoribosyl-dephospho-CoA synthase [Methylotenera sp.]MDP3210687.1 triphosphoribosyl-dephospho-CoA synthase [Methylotenera sp.]
MTPEKIAKAYHDACLAELQALKPGNVHVFADGHGMTIHDFVKSADVSAAVIAQPNLSVGERILHSVIATKNAVDMNTNLGVILLCAPLIHAAYSINSEQTLQQNLNDTLSQLTINDAQYTAEAILLANPAGLGAVYENDVHEKPYVTLLAMMQSAQYRDRIAWQYANSFSDIFNVGLSRYAEAQDKWQNRSKTQNNAWATTAVYLGFLASQLDTHIVRKYGESLATDVMNEAYDIDAAYLSTDNPKLIQKKLLDWDASLKNRNINPGTSADITVACVLASFLQ